MNPKSTNSLCDVSGIKVGHAQDQKALTGCTVVLCEKGGIGGVEVRGSAPGTRETELLNPIHLVQKIHGILLTGGSAFGLDAAGGVQQYLEEKNIGYDTKVARVPIVPAAVIFDLAVGNPKVRPDKAMGYRACKAASSKEAREGRIGAATGATVGKILGPRQAMPGGLGTCSTKLGQGITVAALAVVNALGDVFAPESGEILAGARKPLASTFLDTSKYIKGRIAQTIFGLTSTTLCVVTTNARLSKEEANKIAQMAQDGIARAIRPAHTMYDGDVSFVIATGEKKTNVNVIGSVAAELVAEAIVRGVESGNSLL